MQTDPMAKELRANAPAFMHELSITRSIVNTVLERAAGARVTRVTVEIGRLSGVQPDAVLFCFDICVEGTAAAGAKLEILRPPGLARCRACGEQVVLEQPFDLCGCGAASLDWLSGQELLIREMEILECALPADVPTRPTRP